MSTAATSLRHLAARIADQRPKAFEKYSLADILSLFKRDALLPQRMINIFGLRGGIAALALIQFGVRNLRPDQWIGYEASDAEAAQCLVPIWTILGWSKSEMIAALAVLDALIGSSKS